MNNIDSIWVQSITTRLDELSQGMDSIQSRTDLLRTHTDMLSNIIETSNNSIANQLTAIDVLLALVAVVVGVASVILGIYISRKKQEIETIANTVAEKKLLVDEVANTTKKLDEQIHCGLKDLYQQLRKEETTALLDRLVLEPRDVSNLCQLLLARDLDDNGFYKIKEAYLKLTSSREGFENQDEYDASIEPYIHDYMILLFQHYCYDSLKDDQICPDLIKVFETMCNCAFKRDIIKSTIDLCRAVSEKDSAFNKLEVLTEYLKAINNSQHKKLIDLKNIFKQNISLGSFLQNAIEQCKKDGVYLELFGLTKPEQ